VTSDSKAMVPTGRRTDSPQVELLNRRRWKTRIELASAIHDYIELWHNTRRRHSSLAMRTPTEAEHAWAANKHAMADAASAKTATTGEVHETSSPGLSDPTTEAIHPNHHLLNNNSNDHAA
jgi:Integrase core domain